MTGEPGARPTAARALLVVMLTVLALVGPTADRASASCGMPVASEVVGWADVIAVGRITEVDDPGASYSPHPVAWTVEVTSVHKGQAPRLLHVESDSLDLPAEGVYVLPLTVRDGRLFGDGCVLSATGTGLGSDLARGIVAAAGPGRPPVEGTAASTLPGFAPVELDSGWIPAGLSFAVLVGALVLALVAVAVVGLRRAGVEARARRAREAPRAP